MFSSSAVLSHFFPTVIKLACVDNNCASETILYERTTRLRCSLKCHMQSSLLTKDSMIFLGSASPSSFGRVLLLTLLGPAVPSFLIKMPGPLPQLENSAARCSSTQARASSATSPVGDYIFFVVASSKTCTIKRLSCCCCFRGKFSFFLMYFNCGAWDSKEYCIFALGCLRQAQTKVCVCCISLVLEIK